MNDQQPAMNSNDEINSNGATTNDISDEAAEALRRFNMQQAEKQRMDIPDIEGDEVQIRVHIEEAATPLMLTIKDTAVIGRRDPTAQISPELDLTPYGGYQMGISRKHAILRFKEKKLTVSDTGSRNGTYVDNKRLKPHQPEQLYDGAELRLGKIIMRVHII